MQMGVFKGLGGFQDAIGEVGAVDLGSAAKEAKGVGSPLAVLVRGAPRGRRQTVDAGDLFTNQG